MDWLRRHPLAGFFLLAYLFTWAIEIPVLLAARGVIGFHLPLALEALAAFGPFAAAIIVLGLTRGKVGIRKLLASLIHWRVPGVWLLITLASPFVVLIVALSMTGETTRLFSGELCRDLLSEGKFLQLVFIGGVLRGIGEEPGWRGFALPWLRGRFGPLLASCALFPAWWLWHLPALLTRNEFQPLQFVMFGLGILAAAIWCTMLYDATRSVLMLVLWHALINITRGMALSASMAAFLAFAKVVVAIAVVIIIYWLIRRPDSYSAEPAPG
jgi:membrane protease YdiL (CAAX protease family)